MNLSPKDLKLEEDRLDPNLVPLFHLKTTDKASKRTVYINFKCTSQVEAPTSKISEARLVDEIRNLSPELEQYKIPLVLSKIYWLKDKPDSSERQYVTDVQINDQFARLQVVPSEIVRHYVISVALSAIEEKFNNPNAAKLYGQYLGHQLDLDQVAYEVLGHGEKQNFLERKGELVENKIMFVESKSGDILADDKVTDTDEARNELETYDLYYRPKSQILTIQVSADQLPDRIKLNDDHVCIIGHKNKSQTAVAETSDSSNPPILLDVHLPLYIDLNAPVKYKFDDKLCLFRAVFKVLEEPRDDK